MRFPPRRQLDFEWAFSILNELFPDQFAHDPYSFEVIVRGCSDMLQLLNPNLGIETLAWRKGLIARANRSTFWQRFAWAKPEFAQKKFRPAVNDPYIHQLLLSAKQLMAMPDPKDPLFFQLEDNVPVYEGARSGAQVSIFSGALWFRPLKKPICSLDGSAVLQKVQWLESHRGISGSYFLHADTFFRWDLFVMLQYFFGLKPANKIRMHYSTLSEALEDTHHGDTSASFPPELATDTAAFFQRNQITY